MACHHRKKEGMRKQMKKLLVLLTLALLNCGQEDRSIDIEQPKTMDMSTQKPTMDMKEDKPIDMKPASRLEDIGYTDYFDHDLDIYCKRFSVATSYTGTLYDICLPDNRIGSGYAFEDDKCTKLAKSTYEDLMLCVREGGGGPVCLINEPNQGNYAAGTNGWPWPPPVLIKYTRLQTVYNNDDPFHPCKPVYRAIGIEQVDLNILGKF